MLTKKTIYILECDNCNKNISADSLNLIIHLAKARGWELEKEKCICKSCSEIAKIKELLQTIKIRRYYSPMRPIGIGTCPKKGYWIGENFNERTYCSNIGREAWGYVEYCRPLTEQEISDYELIPDPENS